MRLFALNDTPIDSAALRLHLLGNPRCGALAIFEGMVRHHNAARQVAAISYTLYPELAQHQGEEILAEACRQFDIEDCITVHRHGLLHVGDIAIWIGVNAAHRDAAFRACRYIIEACKKDLPVWKEEHFI